MRENDKGAVREDYVEEALERVEKEEIKEGISDLNDHERYILSVRLTLAVEDETSVQLREIYSQYHQVWSLTAGFVTTLMNSAHSVFYLLLKNEDLDGR
ncbi:hypothetical protein [Halorussus salinisoli]|uniref:hypothetical protein n=1 Tax=Halorussus salinisoli TaxID=2558242 RepID=UPI0014857CDA|nr:hypothetical protein [Halorussus salinisoli]